MGHVYDCQCIQPPVRRRVLFYCYATRRRFTNHTAITPPAAAAAAARLKSRYAVVVMVAMLLWFSARCMFQFPGRCVAGALEHPFVPRTPNERNNASLCVPLCAVKLVQVFERLSGGSAPRFSKWQPAAAAELCFLFQ